MLDRADTQPHRLRLYTSFTAHHFSQLIYYGPEGRGQCRPRRRLSSTNVCSFWSITTRLTSSDLHRDQRPSVTHHPSITSPGQSSAPSHEIVLAWQSNLRIHSVVHISEHTRLYPRQKRARPHLERRVGPPTSSPRITTDHATMCFITERPMSSDEYTSPRAPRRASNYHAGPSGHSVGYNRSSVSSLPGSSSRSSVRRYGGGSGVQDALVVYEKRRPVKVNQVVYV